jgi:hypothetical protein
MSSDRREFMKLAGATVAVASPALAATAAVAQTAGQFKNIEHWHSMRTAHCLTSFR